VDVSALTEDQVAALCSVPEGHFSDRKSARVSPAKLSRAASAFANADGGELLVGIEDDGTWAGRSDPEAFNGHIQALERLFPYGTEFQYEFLQHPVDGSVVLRITVQKTRDIKLAHDGKAYIRRGAQCLEVTDMEALRRQKGLATHETATLRYPIEDLTNSAATIGFMLSVVPTSEPEPWLRKQNLIIGDTPTVAGTLLFHDEPQVHLPKAAVKLYRYTTTDDEGSREQLAYDPVSIEGPVYDVIAAAVAETVRQVQEIPVLDAGGFAKVQYPQETLHEIITNAVIHRDYAVNDDVHIRIFDNRIEVQSPGALPANITPSNILSERFARNPVVVRLLNKFPNPPNKDVGEGLNTAFAAMRKLELRDPIIEERGSAVLVTIRHESLASPESRIVEYVKVHGSINNREARNLLNRPDAERSIRRLFEKLVDAHELERVPGTTRGGSRYRIPTGDDDDGSDPSGETPGTLFS
jgi:ATP-dependent DNA helicase RecG